MYKKISDYGIIGDLHSIALIGLDGSIDWLCLPYIDSPSIFGALLDDKKGGRFSVSPLQEWDSVAEYIPDTNILKTTFRTRTGIMQITDFMPISFCGEEELEEERHHLYRFIEIKKGTVDVGLIFEPRFDYARAETMLEKIHGGVIARGNGKNIALSCVHYLEVDNERATTTWSLSEKDQIWLHLEYDVETPTEFDREKAECALRETSEYWHTWLKRSETGKTVNFGSYHTMVNRSALILKLLYYSPTGAIAAAATTSLPEEIGGMRNWDYRYTWVRDTSFTLQVLFNLGHISETEGYLRWVEGLISTYGAEKLQVMYGLRGEEDLPEENLIHLDGYKGSKPVRIGNGAVKQKQLDIYGEIMDAALKLSDYVGKIDSELWPFFCSICDYVAAHWRDKDHGVWEIRGGPHSFVYSKVMCWVALDRGLTISHRYGFPGNLKAWKKAKSDIKEEVLEKGWNKEKKAFVQHYETDALDSSNLLLPLLGFLPFEDFRIVSTIEAIQKELSYDGFLYRYTAADGLPGSEGVFLVCTFWLINCLALMGRLEEAERLLTRAEQVANHVGLFSEEYDFSMKETLGNFPQAFTHIGYINSVVTLMKEKEKVSEQQYHEKRDVSLLARLVTNKIVLNEGDYQYDVPIHEIMPRLKSQMNLLRGAFFDTERKRVAYEHMRNSNIYKEYIELSRHLKRLQVSDLKIREERIAFWVNLYNVMVIHGVIEMGIRDSVKEVRNFFKRVQYQIGDVCYTPDDVEHGILRGNGRPPNSLFKLFKRGDSRMKSVIRPVDPRIHFALVCASSSCPPIEIYTAENLEKELTIAGETFLNGGGVRIDRELDRVSLSRIFKWYGSDFAKTESEVLRMVASYLYDPNDRKYLETHAERIRVDYQEYDWRLNRY